MNISIGLVGLPNVGKSTLFNALLKQQVALAANYPFATIDPNTGIAQVPDARLEVLAKIVNTTVIKPATVEFVDIAGLVKGASQGAGLGNQFLSHIRETAAICHVLRAFSDEDIIREGSTDPLSDLQTIRIELQLADLATLDKQREPKGSVQPADKERWAAVQQLKAWLEAEEPLAKHLVPRSSDDALVIAAQELCLLSAKPEIFALNVDEDQLSDAQGLAVSYAAKLGVEADQVVVVSARIESELAALSESDQRDYLADLGMSEGGLERLARVAYQALHLQSFLTAGEKEVRAWTVRVGAAAPEAAGVIHTDFIKHFIKANVASYADFVEHQGWKGVREAGRLRTEGKEYRMQEGDVVEFMIGK